MQRVWFLAVGFSLMARLSVAALVPKLSEAGLYENIVQKTLVSNARAFSPQYPLWTDGAEKQRWILLPEGTKIDTSDLDRFVFPDGTKIFKEFSFRDTAGTLHRVETRMMQKTGTLWEFGTYVWAPDESEATLAGPQGIKNHFPINETQKHDIPSIVDCKMCHRPAENPVLGFELLQLSRDRDPGALHSSPPVNSSFNLDSLNAAGLLTHYPTSLAENPPRIHARSPEGRSAMGYLHANCGHCHQPEGSAGFTELFFRHRSTVTSESEEPAFQTAIGKATTGFAIPGEIESIRIAPGDPAKSAVFYRLQASGFDRMPPRGTKIHDQQAIELIRRWIETLPVE